MFNFLKWKSVDWQNSSAHLDFLSYFLEPRQSQSTEKIQKWSEPMGEPVEVVLKRFLELGMLQRLDTINSLLVIFQATELKKSLKERRLLQSGTKAVMAARLVDIDAPDMQQLISGHLVLICSEKGKSIAQAYKEREKQRLKEAQALTLKELNDGHYRKAASALADYEAKCVFQRGININWKDFDTTRDEKVLHYVFTRTPQLVIKRGWDKLPNTRIIAGMKLLWGKAINAGITCDAEIYSAASAFLFHALFLYEIDEYRSTGIKKICLHPDL